MMAEHAHETRNKFPPQITNKYHISNEIYAKSNAPAPKVWKITEKHTGIAYALKKISKNTKIEVEILKSVSHENIISYVESWEFEDFYYFVMEWAPKRDLLDYLNNPKTP